MSIERESEQVVIKNIEKDIKRAYEVMENFIFDIKLGKKDAFKLRLLGEETLDMTKTLAGDDVVITFWLNGNNRECCINLSSKTELSSNDKEKLMSLSTTGENLYQRGFMNKVRSLFEGRQEKKVTWSLEEYRKELNLKKEKDIYSQEAWEDLERSIVANLADSVEVGIDSKGVKLVIIKKFESNDQ